MGALADVLRRLDVQQSTYLAHLRQAAEGASDRRLVRVAACSLAEALADPALGPHVLRAGIAAYGSTQGLGGSAMCECFLCQERWGAGPDDRSPGAVAIIATTKPDAFLVTFICDRCTDDVATLEHRLGQATRRDFFGGEGEVVPISALAPGGRA